MSDDLAPGTRVEWRVRGDFHARTERGAVVRVSRVNAWIKPDSPRYGPSLVIRRGKLRALTPLELAVEEWERDKPSTSHVDVYSDFGHNGLGRMVYRFAEIRGPVADLGEIADEIRALRAWLLRRPE